MKHRATLAASFVATFAIPAMAATTFITDPNTLTGATWDDWFNASSTVTTGLNQGSAQTTFGSIAVNSSLVTTDILAAYDSPPGGLFGSDSYYVHNGGYQWNVDAAFDDTISLVRISYSLVGFGGTPEESDAFANAPTIADATLIDSGIYVPVEGGRAVFYYDFELDTASDSISTSFGDIITPGFYAGSFRSIDAIQIEGANDPLTAIPEPSTAMLGLLAGGIFLRRRRNAE